MYENVIPAFFWRDHEKKKYNQDRWVSCWNSKMITPEWE
jgi:hypothetical protein